MIFMRVIKQHWLLEIVFNITAAILRRKVIMSDFSIREMLTMQQTLSRKMGTSNHLKIVICENISLKKWQTF